MSVGFFDTIPTMKIKMSLVVAAALSVGTAVAGSCIVDPGAYSGEPATWKSDATASDDRALTSVFEGRVAAADVSQPIADCERRWFSLSSAILDIFKSTDPRGLLLLFR